MAVRATRFHQERLRDRSLPSEIHFLQLYPLPKATLYILTEQSEVSFES